MLDPLTLSTTHSRTFLIPTPKQLVNFNRVLQTDRQPPLSSSHPLIPQGHKKRNKTHLNNSRKITKRTLLQPLNLSLLKFLLLLNPFIQTVQLAPNDTSQRRIIKPSLTSPTHAFPSSTSFSPFSRRTSSRRTARA